jgi:hypothetical protein
MVCSPLFFSKLGYLVEEMADLCVKRTLIDFCWHKAVRISVRKTFLHYASVNICEKAAENGILSTTSQTQ